MDFEFQYRITYESGQFYDRPLQLCIPITKEEYKIIMQGIVDGIPINEIKGISEVKAKMTERVQDMDRWTNMNGSLRSEQLKKLRSFSHIEFSISLMENQRIKRMKDPMAVFERQKEHMTLYCNDGSSVHLSCENGKVTISDSKKDTYSIMDVEHFLSYITR